MENPDRQFDATGSTGDKRLKDVSAHHSGEGRNDGKVFHGFIPYLSLYPPASSGTSPFVVSFIGSETVFPCEELTTKFILYLLFNPSRKKYFTPDGIISDYVAFYTWENEQKSDSYTSPKRGLELPSSANLSKSVLDKIRTQLARILESLDNSHHISKAKSIRNITGVRYHLSFYEIEHSEVDHSPTSPFELQTDEKSEIISRDRVDVNDVSIFDTSKADVFYHAELSNHIKMTIRMLEEHGTGYLNIPPQQISVGPVEDDCFHIPVAHRPLESSEASLSMAPLDIVASQKLSSPDAPSERASRNIALLSFYLVHQLKKGSQTRDDLSRATNFARQRVCTVLSVYKAIGLVGESQTKKSAVEWNEQQARILPDINHYIARILELRHRRRMLRKKEEMLMSKLMKKGGRSEQH